jgi:hypothetical protein
VQGIWDAGWGGRGLIRANIKRLILLKGPQAVRAGGRVEAPQGREREERIAKELRIARSSVFEALKGN